MTNFLRDHVWGGERIVGFVKQELFADAFIETGAAGALAAAVEVSPAGPASPADGRCGFADNP